MSDKVYQYMYGQPDFHNFYGSIKHLEKKVKELEKALTQKKHNQEDLP